MDYDINENIEDIESLEDKDQKPVKMSSNPNDFPQPLYELNLDYSKESFYATADEHQEFKTGDFVLVPTRYGNDAARFGGPVKAPINANPDEVVKIIRKINAEEESILEENNKKRKRSCQDF